MAAKKNQGLTRDQAAELYKDLHQAMGTLKAKKNAKIPDDQDEIAKKIAQGISRGMARDVKAPQKQSSTPQTLDTRALPMPEPRSRSGQISAVSMVLFFAATKVVFSGLEATGILSAQPAQASMVVQQAAQQTLAAQPAFSKEEMHVLTSLDQRRSELEERSSKLDSRQADLERRDREFATKLNQLRELTETLKLERDKGEKKRNLQLDQLSNVYGAMAPQEAAKLIEQLDETIALSLLERMPEKRMGQILALMAPQKALSLTKTLSVRSAE